MPTVRLQEKEAVVAGAVVVMSGEALLLLFCNIREMYQKPRQGRGTVNKNNERNNRPFILVASIVAKEKEKKGATNRSSGSERERERGENTMLRMKCLSRQRAHKKALMRERMSEIRPVSFAHAVRSERRRRRTS